MKVLIVVVGHARRAAAVSEAGAVQAAGSEVTLYLAEPVNWARPLVEAGVAMQYQRDQLWQRHWPQKLARLLLWRLPLFVLHRAARGPLRTRMRTLARSYQRRVALPVQRKLVDRVHRRLWPDAAARCFAAHVAEAGYDVVIPVDPMAILLMRHTAPAAEAPRPGLRVAYSFDHVPVGGGA